MEKLPSLNKISTLMFLNFWSYFHDSFSNISKRAASFKRRVFSIESPTLTGCSRIPYDMIELCYFSWLIILIRFSWISLRSFTVEKFYDTLFLIAYRILPNSWSMISCMSNRMFSSYLSLSYSICWGFFGWFKILSLLRSLSIILMSLDAH
jgi:hypothetical protein